MQIDMAEDHEINLTRDKESQPLNLLEGSLVQSLKEHPVETVRALVTICEKAMQPQAYKWERYSRKYRRGLRYVTQDGAKSPLYSTNYVYNNVETLKANLTKGLPAMTIQPVEDGDDVAADVFSKVLRVELKKADLKGATERVVQNGAVATVGWYKTWYSDDAQHGKGGLVIDALAPEDVLVLPTMLDYKQGDVFIHRLRDLPEAQIKALYKVDKLEGSPESTFMPNDRSIGDVDRKMPNIRTFNVYEAWVKDYETGDWYICTIAGYTLLREPAVSPYDHGRAPFVPWYDGIDPRADQAYTIGIGEVEEMEMLQDMADALDQRIYKNVKQVTGRQRVLNPASGINPQDIDDVPNRVYLCTGRPSDAMMWDNPPALSQEVYLYRERIEDRIQIVTGNYDSVQGKKPGGIQAARAVSALQSQGVKRIEKKQDLLIRSQEDVAFLSAKTILQMYDGERIIRLAGQNLKIVAEYPASLSELPNENEMQADLIESNKKSWKEQNGIDLVLSDIDFDFDVYASTDSSLPDDKGERVQLAADLFRLGVIDRQALLEAVDYPNRQEILKRLAGGVTGKTPAEAMPENQAGVAQAQAQQAQIDGAQQQAQQAQKAQIDQALSAQEHQQQMAQQLKTAYGAMAPMPNIPV